LIRARLYDGRTSAARTAEVAISAVAGSGRLLVRSGEFELTVPLAALGIGERVGSTNRLLQLPEGGSVEILDNAAFDAALECAGICTREAPLRRLEGHWQYALAALLLTVAGTFCFFRFGVPALAARAVRLVPSSFDAVIGADTLSVLDRSTFRPTQLGPQRRAQLRQIFAAVCSGASADSAHFRLEFRGGGALRANAFALPSGIVVLTDELEHLSKSDDELRGVFAHEVGHLVNRHAMRMLVAGSATALLVAGVFGDVSGVTSLATAAPTVLVTSAYSRDFEREADEFAYRWMSQHHVDPQRLADLLARLAAHEGDGGGLLATHPNLRARLRTMRRNGENAAPE
jgi:Zn-dependent protease with chaperone function